MKIETNSEIVWGKRHSIWNNFVLRGFFERALEPRRRTMLESVEIIYRYFLPVREKWFKRGRP